MWTPLVLVALAVVVALIYNGLVKLRVQSENAWSDIDVQLKRRHDLVPNLVESVKGYAGHENQTLEAVIRARSQAVVAGEAAPKQRAAAENLLTQALRQLMMVSEDYPDLKASPHFMELQETLEELEGALANARRYYNAVVRDLNVRIGQFPSNLVARTFGFRPREFFELEDEAARVAPRVAF